MDKPLSIASVFQSIQGEGVNAGRPATFLRLATCNGTCPWCDTDYAEKETSFEDALIARFREYATRFLVITGGEPMLQVTGTLLLKLKISGFETAIETNGSIEIPPSHLKLLSWVTVSPKIQFGLPFNQKSGDELKVIWDGKINPLDLVSGTNFKHKLIQPEWSRREEILSAMLKFLQENPEWRLSLQTHRLLNVP